VTGLKQWLKRELNAAPREAERAEALLAQESVMRIMSAQVTIQPSGHEFFVEGNDTLLEAALRAGIPLNYGCSNGNCGECKARLVSGQVRKVHPHDFVLKEPKSQRRLPALFQYRDHRCGDRSCRLRRPRHSLNRASPPG
jgi:CDP-4-dehydro-6-deoxyglucose reductase, E3